MEEQTLQRTAVEKANALSHLFGALLAIPAGWYVISNGFDKGLSELLVILMLPVDQEASAA